MEEKKDNIQQSEKDTESVTRELTENPYNPDNKKPEDIVRLFYQFNVPIIPVISKRGILLGLLREEDVTSEMSDIERIESLKIDKFISKLIKKMTLDDLLAYAKKKDLYKKEHQREFFKIKEFTVINLFGEVQGAWSRLQLFTACESPDMVNLSKKDIEDQSEEQILEWIIYLILEHIPRALYALNDKGKTIFYNSIFEDIYVKKFKKDVDAQFIEKSFKSANKNDVLSNKNRKDLTFLNRDLDMTYEKIPLINKKKKVGFLIFGELQNAAKKQTIEVDVKKGSLGQIIDSFERDVLVRFLQDGDTLQSVAKELEITKKTLQNKIDKLNIKTRLK